MHQKLYQIPEEACHCLPKILPGEPAIRLIASDSLCPTPNQATASTIQFITNRGPVILQGVAASPLSQGTPTRTLLFVMLYNRDTRPLFFDRDLKRIKRFLGSLGAIEYRNKSSTHEQAVAQWKSDNPS
jgi:hypothetical protein